MVTQDQVITSVSQELHTVLVPPAQVRLEVVKSGVMVMYSSQEVLGTIAAHFGMVRSEIRVRDLIPRPRLYLPVTHLGWRVSLDLEIA